MAPIVDHAVSATPRERLAGVRPQPVKAELDPQEGATSMRQLAKSAIQAVSGQKAAAIDIGIHEGRLSHKLSDGTITLAELETLGPKFAARFGADLVEMNGPLATPLTRARQKLRESHAALDEIEQLLEFIA